jgi:hypothetical protein
MLKNNRIDDGHFFEFLFLLFLKAKIQTSAFGEFTESFLQYRKSDRSYVTLNYKKPMNAYQESIKLNQEKKEDRLDAL